MCLVCVQLVNVDRLSQKLRAMSYIANFSDAFKTIHPVISALFISAILILIDSLPAVSAVFVPCSVLGLTALLSSSL